MTSPMNPFITTPPKKSLTYYLFWLISYTISPVLVPFRIVCLLIILLLAKISMTSLIKNTQLQKPLSSIRTAITRFFTIYLTKFFIISLGVQIKQKNPQKRPNFNQNYALISNHNSSLDPLILQVMGACSFVSKSEVQKSPIFGLFARANQCIFIDRKDKNSSKIVQEKLIERISGDVFQAGFPRKYQMLTVFPEGTCSSGNAVLPFKAGVFNAKKPVQMCIIRWDRRFSKLSDSDQSLSKVILNMIFGLRQVVEVEWLGEYIPSVEEVENGDLYASNVRELYAEKMGVGKTNFGLKERYWYVGKIKDYSVCSDEWKQAFPESIQLKK